MKNIESQQFVASMLFASILPRTKQDLERHVESLQRGEPVEVNAETGLNPAGQLLPQWACEKKCDFEYIYIWDY